MEIRICESHIKIYKYFKKLAKKQEVIQIKHDDLIKVLKLGRPTVLEGLRELNQLGCITRLTDGRGLGTGGAKYTVDTEFEVIKTRVKKEKIHKIKSQYWVTVLELKKD